MIFQLSFNDKRDISLLGHRTQNIDWNMVLGKRYKEFLPKIVRWSGYVDTDPTAWINITDTINDPLLDVLYSHDIEIGSYQHGNIGGSLSSNTSRFARKYPKLYNACKIIHGKRLESDLSHPKVQKTGKSTNYVKYRELKPIIKNLADGYVELWSKW